MESKVKVKKGEILVVLIPRAAYHNKKLDLVTQLSGKTKSVCYVNLTSSTSALMDSLATKVSLNKFLFVDGTKSGVNSDLDNCVCIGSPESLTGLSLAVKKALQTGSFNVLFFDSISALLVYNDPDTVTRFLHDLFSSLRDLGVSAVFTAQAGTSKSVLGDVCMFADNSLNLE
jgi:archaellum biogenesis ATPase FlaH